MQSFPPEVWDSVERSLACAAKAKRLTEKSSRLRERSEKLRHESQALLAASPNFDKELAWERKVNRTPFLIQKLRIRAVPPLET